MSLVYVNRVLLEDEAIERRPRLSNMAAYGAPIVEFALAAGAWSLMRWIVLGPWLQPSDPRIAQWMFWAYLAGMALFAGRLVFRLTKQALSIAFREIAVTNRRFMEKSGVLSVRFFSTDLEKIVRVAIDQSLLGRMFNYGDVTIVTVGEVSHTTHDVAAPIALQQSLHARMTGAEVAASPFQTTSETVTTAAEA